MEADEIKSIGDLRTWLEGKPTDWAQVIAVRVALRVMPWITFDSRSWLQANALHVVRSNVIAWAACNYTSHKFDRAALNAVKICSSAVATAKINHDYGQPFGATYAATNAALAVSSNDAAGLAFDSINQIHAGTTFWYAVQRDCVWLSSQKPSSASRALTRRGLWLDRDFGSATGNLAVLLEIDSNYAPWLVWYERRIRGERAAFDIPGDKGRIEDKKILRRLAEATDEDFWGKGHEYVNATLKSWLEEARERVQPEEVHALQATGISTGPPEIGQSTLELAKPLLDLINPDQQDARSPQFGSDATGRIAIKPNAGSDQLRSDLQSLSRHARAVQMAQKLGEALRSHNNAGYITEMVDAYVAAMGNGPESSDPSGLVFAGDQLREAIAKHRAAGPDDDLQPLPPSADRDASGFLSAHNMYVGSDPFLDDLDRTTRGPDAPLPAANPDEIRRVANAARQADILAERTYEYMVAASDAAPAAYDPADRHSRFAAGLAQNFARYGIEFLWAYPNEAAWAGLAAGVGVTVMVGPVAAAGGAVAGITIAYQIARNIIANEDIYQKLLATSPAGEDNFNRLIRFLKSLPIKSLKDD